MRLIGWAGLAAALLAGCFDDDDGYEDTRARGDLGKGTFVYGCHNDTDTSCDDGGTNLPSALAVGSRFDMRFSISSGAQPSVVSPATDLVRRVGNAFEVRAAGQFPLLAVNANREVIDIKHLYAADVGQIRVQRNRELPVSSLRLAPRESATLLALPYDQGGVKLGGALSYAWSSSDEALLLVESLPELNRVRVRAGNREGKATLLVRLPDAMYEVTVQIGDVGDAEVDELDAGATDAGDAATRDAAADAGADGASPGDDAEADAGGDV
jgi:hypothetical protein